MKAQTLIFCLTLTLVLFANASDMPVIGKLDGVVMDSEGAIIANATVIVHRDWPADYSHDLNLITDKAGNFSTDLNPGFYDVAIFAHAFSPNARKVRIRIGQTTKHNVTLPLDPQISAEIGGMQVESADPPSGKPKQ